MATLTQFRASVAAKVGVIDDQDILDAWINEGCVDFLLQTRVKVKSGTVTLTAGEPDFEIDTDILLMEDAYIVGADQNYPMTPVGVHDILEMRQTLVAVGTGPLFYAMAGSNLMMLHPTPTAAVQLRIYYVPRPVVLAVGSDTPSEIPAEFHKAVEWYAAAEAADADDDQSSAQGQRYRDEYEKWIGKARKYRNLMGNSRLPAARLARRRLAYARREDVYPGR